jgi:hypothetical protein
MKVRVVCRKLYDYIRYDLKEIAFPSSLPDPPNLKKRPKLTWEQRIWVCCFPLIINASQFYLVELVCYLTFSLQVLKRAARLYAASWVRDIGPDLRPNDYKTDEMTDEPTNALKKPTKDKEPSTLEDLGTVSFSGSIMLCRLESMAS